MVRTRSSEYPSIPRDRDRYWKLFADRIILARQRESPRVCHNFLNDYERNIYHFDSSFVKKNPETADRIHLVRTFIISFGPTYRNALS